MDVSVRCTIMLGGGRKFYDYHLYFQRFTHCGADYNKNEPIKNPARGISSTGGMQLLNY